MAGGDSAFGAAKWHESLNVPRIAPGASRALLRNTLPHSHNFAEQNCGALAQLGERLICIQEVRSSILLGSTNLLLKKVGEATVDWRSQSHESQAEILTPETTI